jgi:hypothetical protein
MDVRAKKRIKRDWAAIFEEFHRSGLSIKEFCQVKEMSQSLFYRRRKDYDDTANSGKPSLRLNDFIQLQPAAISRPSASIVFGGQIELSIHNDCDKALLRHIISQLKGSPC